MPSKSDRSGRAGNNLLNTEQGAQRCCGGGAGVVPRSAVRARRGKQRNEEKRFSLGTLIQTLKPEIMDNNALKGNSLQLQLHHLGVETESQTIDLVGSILHLLSYEAKQSVFNIVASHLEVTPNIENTNPENDLPH